MNKSATVVTFWLSVSFFSNLIGFLFGVFLKWLAVGFKWCFKQILAWAIEFGCATKLPWLSDSLNRAKQLVLWGDSLMERFPRNNGLSWALLAWDLERVPLVSLGPGNPSVAGASLALRDILLCSLFSSHWICCYRTITGSQWDASIFSFLFPLALVDTDGELLPLEKNWEEER